MNVGLIGTIAGVLGVIIAVGTLLGTAMRVGRQTTTVNNYREAAQSWEAKARAQESEIADLQAKVVVLEQARAGQDKEIQVLRDMVTGRTAIAELTVALKEVVTKAEFAAWQAEVRSRLEKQEEK